MTGGCLDPVGEHLPEGEPKGRILVISDYRPLNRLHSDLLNMEGYAVYTAETCTDVPRVFEAYQVSHVDLVVFASLVHGWHEHEGRPSALPQETDPQWQVRNMKAVVDLVSSRQATPPRVLIADELMAFDWYGVTPDALASVGLQYATYPVSEPQALAELLR